MLVRPAFDRHFSVARIDTDSDPPGIAPRCLPHELGIAHRRRADDDALDALAKPAFDRAQIANPAAKLHRHFYAGENQLDGFGIHRPAGEGTIEIDDVKIFEALPLKNLRLRRRVGVEDGGLGHVALHEAHACAAFEIDSRK